METLFSTPQRPGRPDYYLQPGELRRAFPGMTELFYEENAVEGWAALLARRAACVLASAWAGACFGGDN
ncbi:MAG: hypothetical protein HY332_18015 [Chloroflexi bacterium]|nr:hypothetical protein [Chloroflexota bacterium]